MACCLTAPTHYLNQWWLSMRAISWWVAELIYCIISLEITYSISLPHLPVANELWPAVFWPSFSHFTHWFSLCQLTALNVFVSLSYNYPPVLNFMSSDLLLLLPIPPVALAIYDIIVNDKYVAVGNPGLVLISNFHRPVEGYVLKSLLIS